MSDRFTRPLLGLIGAIGAGKSTAANLLSTHGAVIVDADRIGHEVLQDERIRDRLVERWGPRILTAAAVNRKAVAEIVFQNGEERRFLEVTVYPEIAARCRTLIAAARSKFVVLDAAVMLEAGWSDLVDKVLYIDAPRETRLKRVASRGWSEEQLTQREAAQWPADRKRDLADAVIVNDGTLDDLDRALTRLLSAWGWI